MNLGKGLFRLFIVGAVVAATIIGYRFGVSRTGEGVFVAVLFAVVVFVIVMLIRWIVSGFFKD